MSRSTITPHPSHRMGDVEGETCCVVCYAAPWMAIVERECGSDVRAFDTTTRDAAIREAYEGGAKIKDIAAAHELARDTVSRIVGRQTGLSEYALERRKRGRGPAITLAQVRDAMVMHASGKTWRQIGGELDRKPASIKDAVADVRAGRGRLAAEAREIAERALHD